MRKKKYSKETLRELIVLPGSIWNEEKIVKRSALLRYSFAIVLVIMVTWVKLLINPFIVDKSPFLFYIGAILLSAGFGGVGPSIIALLLSVVASDFFFSKPLKILP